MKIMIKLTHQEEGVMRMIWRLEECTVKEIQNQMPEPRPPYTTISSIVANLVRKGYVSGSMNGRGNPYVFKPIVGTYEYMVEFMSGVASSYFGDSFKSIVSFFAVSEKISAEELREILEMIESGESEQH